MSKKRSEIIEERKLGGMMALAATLSATALVVTPFVFMRGGYLNLFLNSLLIGVAVLTMGKAISMENKLRS